LAAEAGVNHGLVHYYFGSNDNVLVQALERFTQRLIARQRDLYASEVPFVEKWRTAMRFLTNEDIGYEKIWFELQALGWNDPDLRERLARVNDEWRSVLTAAFEAPHRELGIPIPLDALVALVMTFNMGVIVERLGGIEAGHKELLEWIDRWLSTQR
jgi:AcrR family transcriptional regulator